MQESAITAKGQTTLPRAVHDALGVSAGDRVRHIVEGNEVRLVKVRSVLELDGILRREEGRSASVEDMDEGNASGAAIDSGLE